MYLRLPQRLGPVLKGRLGFSRGPSSGRLSLIRGPGEKLPTGVGLGPEQHPGQRRGRTEEKSLGHGKAVRAQDCHLPGPGNGGLGAAARSGPRPPPGLCGGG